MYIQLHIAVHPLHKHQLTALYRSLHQMANHSTIIELASMSSVCGVAAEDCINISSLLVACQYLAGTVSYIYDCIHAVRELPPVTIVGC